MSLGAHVRTWSGLDSLSSTHAIAPKTRATNPGPTEDSDNWKNWPAPTRCESDGDDDGYGTQIHFSFECDHNMRLTRSKQDVWWKTVDVTKKKKAWSRLRAGLLSVTIAKPVLRADQAVGASGRECSRIFQVIDKSIIYTNR